ncbi:glycosyltransferase [Alloalcanivorax xenomutans]|uniref:Glycosyltransferase n=1 Tax=Alloalcanivorax xenomutans TaxID=1094342 RepID=A0A9Q3ZDF3_9GAMM|nr:glycosyltransferase [Alloalcanivorax xenomutans]MCE7509430.1 glycosyltransferase [Alloalcanivorax xenomutans]
MRSVLVISTRGKQAICGQIWQGVSECLPMEWKVVERESDILSVVTPLKAGHEYSRVVIDANLRRFGAGAKQLRGLSRLVLFDHDICQEVIPDSDWYRRYVPIMKYIGVTRVIVSSAFLANHLCRQGLDTVCIAKAYDSSVINDLQAERDLDAAFVGRTAHRVYRRRKRLLDKLKTELDVPILRSQPGEPYNALLNRIRVFVSADVGFNEYMIKNFEAMAAGCTLLAWRQPDSEQELLGFQENEHLFMYSDIEELKKTLVRLKQEPALAEKVAAAGRDLVVARHQWRHRVIPMVEALTKDIAPFGGLLSFRDRLRLLRL